MDVGCPHIAIADAHVEDEGRAGLVGIGQNPGLALRFMGAVEFTACRLQILEVEAATDHLQHNQANDDRSNRRHLEM